MKTKALKIPVSKTIGKVSAEIIIPDNIKAMLTIAHGAGAGMRHPFLTTLAKGLAENSIGTVRFNFPYMEKGGKRPDPPAIAEKTVEAIIITTKELYPKLPLFTGGKSFGGRMTSQFLSKQSPENVKGIIFFGFPLHPPGKPSVDRAKHLKGVKIPMLFLQGTRDALATIDLMESLCASLPKATLKTFEGADHSFRKGKEVFMNELIAETTRWINNLL